MDTNMSFFTDLLLEKGIQLTERQLEQFEAYYHELIDWNEKINLTAITEKSQVYLKHFYDSISLSFFVDFTKIETLADIGAGAGFPSIPLKIVYPHMKVTIIDSLNKRIQFLNQLVEKLGLSHVQCFHARAEEAGRKPSLRDQFDLVTARAVARLNVLNEFCLPFVKAGGYFASMKGSDPAGELNEAKKSIQVLRGELKAVHHFELPVEGSSRHIILIEKKGATPAKFPRKAGTPLKDPIV